ncbi:MAG: hypothetical protein ACREEA_12315 [Stellaceae bacterium]
MQRRDVMGEWVNSHAVTALASIAAAAATLALNLVLVLDTLGVAPI